MRKILRKKPEAICPYCKIHNSPFHHCEHYYATFTKHVVGKPFTPYWDPLYVIQFLHPVNDMC